jgi:hypothetical protein
LCLLANVALHQTGGHKKPHASIEMRARHFLFGALLAVWLVGLVLTLTGRRDTFDPSGKEYGANWPGDLQFAIAFVTAETLVLGAVLRPWSYARSTGRVGATLGVVILATVITFVLAGHAGRIMGSLWLWNVVLVVAFLGGTLAAIIQRHWAQSADQAS